MLLFPLLMNPSLILFYFVWFPEYMDKLALLNVFVSIFIIFLKLKF